MVAQKKWMVVLSDMQYDWIKDTADKTSVSGASVLRALITQAMAENTSKFRQGLLNTQLQEELDALEEKERIIEEKKRELKAKIAGREKAIA